MTIIFTIILKHLNSPVPSTVESNTTTAVARVADGGIVVRELHTISVEFSATLAMLGIAKFATAKIEN